MQQVICGVSGATVIVRPNDVIKYANKPDVLARVIAQGHWLNERHDVIGMPDVLTVTDVGYTMRKLQQIEFDDPARGNATDAMLTTYNILDDGLWLRPAPMCSNDFSGLYDYVAKLVAKWLPHNGAILLKFITDGHLEDCTWCDTHGDPTLDNLMVDHDHLIHIIDPLPSSDKIPPLRAVDLGKMLQSAFGYELVKFQSLRHVIDAGVLLREMKSRETDADMYAAMFFCAVHYLRLLPYQTNEVNRETYRKIASALCVRI